MAEPWRPGLETEQAEEMWKFQRKFFGKGKPKIMSDVAFAAAAEENRALTKEFETIEGRSVQKVENFGGI